LPAGKNQDIGGSRRYRSDLGTKLGTSTTLICF
jgi:hypothetical protein